jgi:heme exporter protein B
MLNISNFFVPALFIHECKKLSKSHQIHHNLFWMLIISGIALPLIVPQGEVSKFAPLLILAYLPGAIISLSNNILKYDHESGDLDFALLRHGPFCIALAKFTSLSLFVIIGLVLFMPLFAMLYSLNLFNYSVLFLCNVCVALQSASLALLLSSIGCYFAKPTIALSSVVLPLVIPVLIICGMFLQLPSIGLAMILLGILLITIIASLLLSSYLIQNIF